jgi:hypothetical protein
MFYPIRVVADINSPRGIMYAKAAVLYKTTWTAFSTTERKADYIIIFSQPENSTKIIAIPEILYL